ncbi:autotransporter outer membrane beta-barrel domain-containing protein [Luteimonas fraxinea]|nr:autotransporter outer membrane beta-barrel domain-containing protein [Luteimonas fraxinea]
MMITNRRMRRVSRSALAGAIAASLSIVSANANAECVPVPTTGNDAHVCSSDVYTGDLVDTGGSNSLTFPAGGSGVIDGNVVFGAGADRIDMQSGAITGNVTQGAGNDSFVIADGTVAGAVSQGEGVDRFVMTGGTIGSLNQGSQLDFAEVHGGRIIGLFFAGDFFTMTGGRIGEVNLEQGNNEMRMSGGNIDGNVSAAQNNDLLELSAGDIGGTVNFGNGANTVRISGGRIGGYVLTGSGVDVFDMRGGAVAGGLNQGAVDDLFVLAGGTIDDAVLQGDGNDRAEVSGGRIGGDLDQGEGSNVALVGGGEIAGALTTGGGIDTLAVTGGSIGSVSQGGGNDVLEISDGVVLGAVNQGTGVDRFLMTGGTIGSLNQGSELDYAEVRGGRIVGLFFAGDFFTMTGGRVGEVDLEQANNEMRMSGGSIDGNVRAAQGNDLLVLTGGAIGGGVTFNNGNDTVIVSGGRIAGDVLLFNPGSASVQLHGNNLVQVSGGAIGGGITTGQGSDRFEWTGAGSIGGDVALGAGDDQATLRGLDDTLLTASAATDRLIDGGTGADVTTGNAIDRLTFDGTTSAGAARYTRWELVALTNASALTLDSDFVLGDAGSATGRFEIDSTSQLLVGAGANAAVAPFVSGRTATLVNAGLIDFTNGASGAGDRLTIVGDYIGAGGSLRLDTVLGDDDSASDRFVIAGGRASGLTGLDVVNAGGAGAQTRTDGILLVQTINGAGTDGDAFALNAPVAAGAYEYLLFRGGISAGTADNWYLRNTLVAAPVPSPGNPDPPPPPQPAPVPPVAPDPGVPEPAPPIQPPSPPSPVLPGEPVPPPPEPPTPGATPRIDDVVPLFRIETPAYAVVPPAAYEMGIAMLGMFHERQGEQGLLQSEGALSAGWVRVLGQRREQAWRGTAGPALDGGLNGVQAGLYVYASGQGGEARHRIGVFAGQARLRGDVRGFALGWDNLTVGDLRLDGDHVGLSWSRIAPGGSYIDAVVMASRLDGDTRSSRNLGVQLDGDGLSASLEGGWPVALGQRWVLEPQAQLIWQRVSFDDVADRFSTVGFDAGDAVTARVGARLHGSYDTAVGIVRPYLKASLWHDISSTDCVVLGGDVLASERRGTALEIGGGVVSRISDGVSVFAVGDVTRNLGGERRRVLEGTLGVRLDW